MVDISKSKQWSLFLELQKAILDRDKLIVEKCLLDLEKEHTNGFNINDDKIKSNWLDLLGLGCLMTGRYSEAQIFLLSEIALLENGEEIDDIQMFYAQYNLGEAFHQQKLHKEAVVHYLLAFNLLEKIEVPSDIEIPHLLRGLVVSFLSQNKFKEAELYALRELALREQLNCVIYDCATDLGHIYDFLEKYEDAEYYFVYGLALLEEVLAGADKKNLVELDKWKENILEHLIYIYNNLFQFDKAQEVFQKLKVFKPKSKFALPPRKIISSKEFPVDLSNLQKITPIKDFATTISRNDLCHCGSGKKYKKCHGR